MKYPAIDSLFTKPLLEQADHRIKVVGEAYLTSLICKLILIDLNMQESYQSLRNSKIASPQTLTSYLKRDSFQIASAFGLYFISGNYQQVQPMLQELKSIVSEQLGIGEGDPPNLKQEQSYSSFQISCDNSVINVINDSRLTLSSHEDEPQEQFTLNLGISQISLASDSRIEKYLESISIPRAEINLFSQKMHLPQVKFTRSQHHQIYNVKAHFRIDAHEFGGCGSSVSFKFACDEAVKMLLGSIFHSFPHLFEQYLALKQKTRKADR